MERLLTSRFGEIEYEVEDVVVFPEGVIGFPDFHRYTLIQHKEGSPFRWLQCLEEGSLAFLVVDPANYVPDYAPEMPAKDAAALKCTENTPMLVYTIVAIPPGRPEDMTLNLAGPIAVNCADRLARQIVLEDDRYPVRHRAFPAKSAEAAA